MSKAPREKAYYVRSIDMYAFLIILAQDMPVTIEIGSQLLLIAP